jgi:hypothetical protein
LNFEKKVRKVGKVEKNRHHPSKARTGTQRPTAGADISVLLLLLPPRWLRA